MPAIPLGRKIFFMAQLRKDLRRSIQSAEERIGRSLDGVGLRHMEGRLAELLNGDILSPGTADGLSRALDASPGRYDDQTQRGSVLIRRMWTGCERSRSTCSSWNRRRFPRNCMTY